MSWMESTVVRSCDCTLINICFVWLSCPASELRRMPTLRLLVSLRGDGPLDAEEDMAAVLWVPGVCCGHEGRAGRRRLRRWCETPMNDEQLAVAPIEPTATAVIKESTEPRLTRRCLMG